MAIISCKRLIVQKMTLDNEKVSEECIFGCGDQGPNALLMPGSSRYS